jgi:hypothetical protein
MMGRDYHREYYTKNKGKLKEHHQRYVEPSMSLLNRKKNIKALGYNLGVHA